MRKERGNSRNPQARGGSHQASQGRASRPGGLSGPGGEPFDAQHPPQLSSEQLIARILEAEPPETYLMTEMKRPVTEANIMMSLTTLADKELVHMISWAKKIPGERLQADLAKRDISSTSLAMACDLSISLSLQVHYSLSHQS